MQANEYYNWTRATVTKPFTARWANPVMVGNELEDIIKVVQFRKGDEVRLFNWRPEGMEAENVRTGEQIFLFFRHFANLRQLTINA